eukprot:40982-Amphidinium_carterae.1
MPVRGGINVSMQGAIHPVFIGLSSGYDSGAIQVCSSHRDSPPFKISGMLLILLLAQSTAKP